MKFLSLATSLLLAGAGGLAREIPNPARLQEYESGEVHATIMSAKRASFASHRAAGRYNAAQYAKIEEKVACANGKAGEFRCDNIDLYSFYSHTDLGSTTGEGSSSWGWTHEGVEYIIIAQVCLLLLFLPPVRSIHYSDIALRAGWLDCKSSR